MIEVEGPVTMYSSNSGTRAANEADSRQRRGPANRRRSVLHWEGPPRQKKCEKNCLKKNLIKKKIFFPRAFFKIIFLGQLEILRGLVCSFAYVFGWIGTEGFGCSLLEELGVILELFTQLCLW